MERTGKYAEGQDSHSEAQEKLEKQTDKKPMLFIKSKQKAQAWNRERIFPPSSITTSLIFPLLSLTTSTMETVVSFAVSGLETLSSLFLTSLLLALLSFFNFVFPFLFYLFVHLFILYFSLFHSSNYNSFWFLPKRMTVSIHFLLPSLVLWSGSSGVGHLPMLWGYFPL